MCFKCACVCVSGWVAARISVRACECMSVNLFTECEMHFAYIRSDYDNEVFQIFSLYLPITASSPASETTSAPKLFASAFQSSRRETAAYGTAWSSVQPWTPRQSHGSTPETSSASSRRRWRRSSSPKRERRTNARPEVWSIVFVHHGEMRFRHWCGTIRTRQIIIQHWWPVLQEGPFFVGVSFFVTLLVTVTVRRSF